ncbi:mucosal addressin cell adhesion molecule 1 [Tamandua tetradactyla]|uniref:mucosal addressin cell adhesion molecule 1 n=1 Tax=Tamandua tetradactyla TaxID=48850 RepID=UPI0040541405
MEQGFVLLLPLCLGLLQQDPSEQGLGAQRRRELRKGDQSLEMEPPEPTVAVALGGSLQLTCRLQCLHGKSFSVQWRGLDTSPNQVQFANGSILLVSSASLAMAGQHVCWGTCGESVYQKTVQLLVYAFPDQLSVSPAFLVPGQGQEVACTAHNVTPVDPETLSFSLLVGERKLEGVRALDQEEELLEDEDMLFRVTARWLLPPLGTPAPAALHCQATMKLPGLELSHRRAIPVLYSPAVTDPPAPASPTTATPEPPTTAALKPPTMAAPVPPTTVALEPLTMATPGTPTTATLGTPATASMEPPATAAPGTPAMATPGTPTTATLGTPATASTEPPATAAPGILAMAAPETPTTATLGTPTTASTEPPATAALGTPAMAASETPTTATLGQGSTHHSRSPGPRPLPSWTSPCHPEIHQLPASSDREAQLELLCVASCGSGVAVRWTQAPGGLAAYETREAGAQAWLILLQARRAPEGWFQCRLYPGGQVASLYLLPKSRASPSVDDAALWTGSSILGLILLAFLARRLRRHCRSLG